MMMYHLQHDDRQYLDSTTCAQRISESTVKFIEINKTTDLDESLRFCKPSFTHV